MRMVGRLLGRVYWVLICPDCNAEMKESLFGRKLTHPVNNCQYSGLKWEYSNPTLQVNVDVKQI